MFTMQIGLDLAAPSLRNGDLDYKRQRESIKLMDVVGSLYCLPSDNAEEDDNG